MIRNPVFQQVQADPAFKFKSELMQSVQGKDLIFCHWHPYVEFLHVREGSLSLTAGTRKVMLHKGDVGIVNSNEIHYAQAIGGARCEVQYLVFTYDFLPLDTHHKVYKKYLEPLVSGHVKIPSKLSRTDNDDCDAMELFSDQECYDRFLRLMTYGLSDPKAKELAIHGELMALIARLHEIGVLITDEIGVSGEADEKQKAIVRYFENHYRGVISVPDVAKAFSFSTDHFYKVFKGITGQTPIGYLHRLRISHAKYLLSTTELSISEIGPQVGFDSVSYFIKIFGSITGMTPKAYRKNTYQS